MNEQTEHQQNTIDPPELSTLSDNNTNPWHTPISQITWGFVLTSLTLNFLALQYILPMTGIIFLYLGFRSLRKENRWFHTAWVIVTIKLIWHAFQLAMNATPLNSLSQNYIVIGFAFILQLALLLVFREALRLTYHKNKIVPSRDPLLSLIIWTVLIAACMFLPQVYRLFALISLIVLYIITLRSLYRVGNELREADFITDQYPVKLSNIALTWAYILSCILFVAFCCILSNHLKLDPTVRAVVTSSETRSKLIELGFPEDILNDISNEDANHLVDAIQVHSSSETLEYHLRRDSNRINSNNSTILKLFDQNLEATTVYVQVPNNLVYVLIHFNWNDDKAFWQDGFTISGNDGFELLNGALLFEKNDTEYIAPIPRLTCDDVTTTGFFGTNVDRQISGAVSFPFGSGHQRGYVLYSVQFPKEQLIGCNIMNFVHNSFPFQYPYTHIENEIHSGSLFFHNNLVQHYTTFELQPYPAAND